MVGTSRAVTNDSIDEESEDVYRHEEAQGGIRVSKRYLKKFVSFRITTRGDVALEHLSQFSPCHGMRREKLFSNQ